METATLKTSEGRLALVSWRSELLSLARQWPELWPSTELNPRLEALDAALLAIDTSNNVILVPST